MKTCLLNLHSRTGLCATALLMIAVNVNGSDQPMTLNEQGYFEAPGFNVLAFENAYTGMFFDEKTAGIMLIHHGTRIATGGAVRLKPTPEQWDQIPTVVERTVDPENNRVDVVLRYEEFDFNSKLRVEAQGATVRISVHLDHPLPEVLEGRAGFNLEFLPSAYFEKTYTMDAGTGIIPLYPASSMRVKASDTQLGQFAGHSTFDDRGRGEFVEPEPIAVGRTLVLAPEDPDRCIQIQSVGGGDLRFLDGRNVAQNGWFVVRALFPAAQTGTVVEWVLTPTVREDWKREPVIGYSQVGYHPDQEKVAVIELDQRDPGLASASLLRLSDEGQWEEVYEGGVAAWGDYFRYRYARFDFSEVRTPGLYRIQYGDQLTGPAIIGDSVFEDIWHPTLDVWFPVQMDHMFVNEAYRVWHGAAHLDDARQAPLNHQHFDGYQSGDSTETQYAPGERIPGLNVGGWFDAGDFDIRTGSHCATVLHLVDAWDHFRPGRDVTFIDQEQRYVDIHRPDGMPDLVQQIEHGALALVAQHRAFGRAIRGIIVPDLHQYHHLGDGSTMTDNLPYNSELGRYESDGVSSGTPDDRWAFTGKSASLNFASIAALAAASRALRGYNDELAEECLSRALTAWEEEQARDGENDARELRFGRIGEVLLQLFLATGESRYAEAFQVQVWPALERDVRRTMRIAIQAAPALDPEYRDKLLPFVEAYKAGNDALLTENPYGVPLAPRGWGGNARVIDWAFTNYLLHQSYPDTIGAEYTHRGLGYLFGCHPYSNTSFVSGVGLRSKIVAYGNNRADYSFIAGGVVPGLIMIRPDYLENKDDWPFLWGENEYVIDICASYIALANAVQDLVEQGRE